MTTVNNKKVIKPFPKPYKQQLLFHNDPRKFRWFCGGVGSGKTLSGVREVLYMVLKKHPGKIGIVCAPTFKYVYQGFLQQFLEMVPLELYEINLGKNTIKFKNGSMLYMRSTSDPESLRGINAAWIYMDEPGSEPNEIIMNEFKTRLRAGDNLDFFMTGTPCGKHHWSAQLFGIKAGINVKGGKVVTKLGTDDYYYDDNYAVIKAKTWDNPLFPIDGEYVRTLMEDAEATPEFLNQQVKADFTSFEGIIFPQYVNNPNLTRTLIHKDYDEFYAGFDFAYSEYGSLIVVGYNKSSKKYGVVEEIYDNKSTIDHNGWFKHISKIRSTYGSKLKWLVADNANPDRIQAIRNDFRGLTVYHSIKDRLGSVRKLQKLFGDEDLLVDPKCIHLVKELSMYHWEKNKVDSPADGNDHSIDALKYIIEQHNLLKRSAWS